ncbi:MAG: RNA methyltransferase [Bacteriovoracaceae bacterium]|nr:RNA methyltransferase [Bacteriovoracaceae bacterium]
MRTNRPKGNNKSSENFFEAEEIIYGWNACEAFFRKRPDSLIKFYTLKEHTDALKSVMYFCSQKKLGYRIVEANDLTKIAKSEHHEGIIMVAKRTFFPAWKNVLSNSSAQCILCVDGVTNPHNLGAMARSGAHFGINACFILNSEMKNLTPAAYRVAQGGWEYFPHYFMNDTMTFIKELKQLGFVFIGLDSHAKKNLKEVIEQYPIKKTKYAFFMGAENVGLSKELRNELVMASIPGTGVLDSLNVSQATAITLAVWRMGL